tara:strand:- start:390 stop:686 length:297 start_codon:yes stop_codon:yes gene_type:complete
MTRFLTILALLTLPAGQAAAQVEKKVACDRLAADLEAERRGMPILLSGLYEQRLGSPQALHFNMRVQHALTAQHTLITLMAAHGCKMPSEIALPFERR